MEDMSKDKYNEIKEYVLSRLEKEGDFNMGFNDFPNKFRLKKPYFKEFKKFIAEDGYPFTCKIGEKSHYSDGYGDPEDPIYFYKQKS